MAHDVRNVQSRQRQRIGDFFEDEVSRVVRADIKVCPRIGHELHAAR